MTEGLMRRSEKCNAYLNHQTNPRSFGYKAFGDTHYVDEDVVYGMWMLEDW